jgi:hypothetical protein
MPLRTLATTPPPPRQPDRWKVERLRDFLPTGPWYAIIQDDSIAVPGWDAHDPAETRPLLKIEFFGSRRAWEDTIQDMTFCGKAFKAVCMEEAQVDAVVKVSLRAR